MTIFGLNVGNSHDAASRIRDRCFKDRFLKRCGDELWWITPVSTVKAKAYRYGKYAFDARRHITEPNTLFCGLHVERGYGPAVALVHRDMVMRDDWIWHRFLSDMSSKVPKAIEKAAIELGQQVYLHVVVSREGDLPAKLSFLSDGQILMPLARTAVPEVVIGMVACGDWAALADSFHTIDAERIQWYWIDVEIGVRMHLGADRDDSEMCAKLLQNFREWFD